MHKPLNPVLYSMLRSRIGKVRFSNEGESAIFGRVVWEPVRQRHETSMDVTGEYYRVCCPFCNDTDYHLYIHHMWMKIDPANGKPMRHLATCYRNDCLHGNASLLEERVFNMRTGRAAGLVPKMPISPGYVADDNDVYREPGRVLPVSQLAPTHAVSRYLRGRWLDPIELGRDWGVSLCVQANTSFSDSISRMILGRIIIPIEMEGEPVGWQGRYPADVDWKDVGMPKYLSLPGWKKSRTLYNYDKAARGKLVVVCEGVTDVWRVGAEAVALFGKTIAQYQLEKIIETWGRDGLCVMMLDPGVLGDNVKAQRQLKRRISELQAVFGSRLVLVQLGDTARDPGDMTRRHAWRVIGKACHDAGINLNKYRTAEAVT